MEDKQTMCLTMCLCYSSASEDLGCRRGDFSRKHYGSVELVSPTHDPLICLLLSLCLGVTVSSSSFFSSWCPLPFCLSIFCWHVWITEGDWWVMTYWVWSSDVLCQHGSHWMLCSWWCRTLLPAQPPKLICCVLMLLHSVFLCGWLLSCWVIVALRECVWVYVPPLGAESVYPDNPQAQEVLGFHSMIIRPTRNILWVCLSAAYNVCRRLVLRRNHMLPISTSRLSLHTVLLGVF